MKNYLPKYFAVVLSLLLSQSTIAKSSLPKYCSMSYRNSNTGELKYRPSGCLEKSLKEERIKEETEEFDRCMKELFCFGVNWKTDRLDKLKDINVKAKISKYGMIEIGTLQMAILAERNIKIIEYLLDKGASPNLTDGIGMQHPLVLAFDAYENGSVQNLDVAKLLIKKGANVNFEEGDDMSKKPIILKYSNNLNIVKTLIDAGANINAKNDYGATALYKSRNIKVIKYLEKNGAKIDVKGVSNQTPLFHKKNKEIIDFFLERGIAIDAKDDDGKTALYRACHTSYGYEDILKYLIEKGAEVNSRANDGTTPLHNASHSGDQNAIKVLIMHKAKVNVRDIDGKTPLHYATNEKWPANKRNIEAVKVLLELGAKANLKDKSGKTPFDYAKNNKYFKGEDILWKLNDLQFE